MSKKSKRITSIVLMTIPSLMLVMSSVMKLTGAKQMVESLSKAGMGNYNLFLLGLIELLSVILLWVPKTRNIGFFLVCSYLGGALSVELASGRIPTAAILLTIIWIAVFLKDPSMFLKTANTESN